MDPRQQRIQDLNEQLVDEYKLLKELEDALRYETEPIPRRKREREIKDVRTQINERQEELQSLTSMSQNTHSVHEEVGKPFKNDKMTGSPDDLPAASNQSQSEVDTSSEGTATTSGKAGSPKVLISYSHDSQKHADGVLELSDHLRADGIDCMLDQYLDSPPEGFPRWMDRQIHDADFVLMICTPTYFRRVMGTEEPGTGLGVRWEGNLIYQYIYNAGTSNSRFIPVILEGASASDIPTPWQGVMYYRPDTTEGYESLYRRLTGQPFILKPKLGPRINMPPRETKTDFDANGANKPHQNISIEVAGEKLDTQFTDDDKSSQFDDALALAIQYHSEIKKKQGELSNISNWFNVRNKVGGDLRDYATQFLNSVREIVEPYSELLDGTTSTELRVDIVQFRYSLITPLHSSVKLLKDLALLLPDISNSYAQSSGDVMRQQAISKALHDLQENIREVNIHIALYEALQNYNITNLKSLYLKLGVPYKDALADSREMKISKLIEYCKRDNDSYEELVREVLEKPPDGLNN